MPAGYTLSRKIPQFPLIASATQQGIVTASGGGTTNFLRADGTWAIPPGTAGSANPSAVVGLSAVNGVAATFMTSDSAPALSQSIAPTWSSLHKFSAGIQVTNITGGNASITITPGSNNSLFITGGANVGLDNGVEIFWKNSGGTYQAVLGADSSNNVNLFSINGTMSLRVPNTGGVQMFSAAPQLTLGVGGGNGAQINLNGSTSGTSAILVNSTGILGFTSNNGGISINANGGNSASLVLNGSTSGSFTIGASSTGTPQYGGTATNDNAPAGNIGEYVSSTVASGSAVALTTATSANMTSISLGAGDWDVWVILSFTGGATTTVQNLQGAITTTSGGFSSTPGFYSLNATFGQTVFNGSIVPTLLVGPVRQSISATTTVFGTALANFGVSTCSVYGIMQARRAR